MAKKVYSNQELQQKISSENEAMVTAVNDLTKSYTLDELNRKPSPESWSANECFHHLNLTFQGYLPAIHKGINQFKGQPSTQYRSGFFGDRMIRGMAPSKGTIPDRKKTKTFRKLNPEHQLTFIETPIDTFLVYINEFDSVISQLSELNLEKVKVKSLVGNIIKFKLGDALQIVHVHNQRHLIQAKNALASIIKS